MEIDGIPLHPLVNDAAVALVPMAVLAGLAFALLPSWRWLTRWAALLATLGGVGALVLTVWTGRDLFSSLSANLPADSPITAQLETHQDRGTLLMWVFVAYTVVVVLAFFTVPAASRLEDGRLGFRGSSAGWATSVLPAAVVLVGLAALVLVVLTGHAGAQVAFGS
jgi:hypothetical protein